MPADTSLPMGARSPQANLRAALIVLCAFAVFSGADTLVKLLTEAISVPQVTFMVTFTALVILVASIVLSRQSKTLWPNQPGLAMLRAGLLAGDTMLIYYAFAALPLADAYVLAFLSPVLVAVFAFIFLGERLSWLGWLGVLLGFAGVIVALKPGVTSMTLGHAAAIGSALLFALSLVLLRRTKPSETDAALVASLLVVLSAVSFIASCAGGGFVTIGAADLATVLSAGLCLFGGHALLVRAFRIGDASVVAPFQYSQILWGCLYGAFVFGAPVEMHTLAGAAIIIVSGWLVLK
jgi:S-adenosylmethionine uptake transporter